MPSQWSACAGTLTAVVRSSEMRAGVAAACLAPAVRSPSRWLSGWQLDICSLSSPGFLSKGSHFNISLQACVVVAYKSSMTWHRKLKLGTPELFTKRWSIASAACMPFYDQEVRSQGLHPVMKCTITDACRVCVNGFICRQKEICFHCLHKTRQT